MAENKEHQRERNPKRWKYSHKIYYSEYLNNFCLLPKATGMIHANGNLSVSEYSCEVLALDNLIHSNS
ncbi:MAG: hypothetical protein KME64_07580 [Scytonematopsis contorta HA4267-MV1]|jgi:hypothetical protein|nr:hypothetical protein [Scytonematopsis contorta HA4267-MV1]